MTKRKSTSSLLTMALGQVLPFLIGRSAGASSQWGSPWVAGFAHLCQELRLGRLTLELPNGTVQVFTGKDGDGPHAVLRLTDPAAARALFLRGDVGFAEAYIDGLWDSPNLTDLISLAAVNQAHISPREMGLGVVRLANRLRHLGRNNSKRKAKRNIAYHYDLGNSFYERWLDSTMTYSSALFEGETEQADMEAAQLAKYRLIAESAGLKPGMRVLEIGCGWGGFAEVAARDYGASVVGLTLSKEQLAYAQARMARQGLSDRVDLRLCDYRDVTGQFDAIASIEMFEAVGEEHWPIYFSKVESLLKPGGRAALQVISIDAKRFETYRRRCDFIQKYIFPGGMLPSVAVLRGEAERVGLVMGEDRMFGQSYAKTLDLWQRAFQHSWPEIAALDGFDPRFKRMWEYYLSYCEAGFAAGTIDVGVHSLHKPETADRGPSPSAGHV